MNSPFPKPEYFSPPNMQSSYMGRDMYSFYPCSYQYNYAYPNYNTPFPFRKRVARINFNSLNNVDVLQLSKNGDVLYLQQLLYPLIFSNITQEDGEQFGSRGALHAFMILQLAVEYYMGVVYSLNEKLNQLQKPEKPKKEENPTQIMKLEAQIQCLKKDIESRDLIIDNLSEKVADLKQERNKLKVQLDSLKAKEISRRINPLSQELSEGEVESPPELKQLSTEPPHKSRNLVRIDHSNHSSSRSTESNKQHHKKSHQKNREKSSESRSYYYSTKYDSSSSDWA